MDFDWIKVGVPEIDDQHADLFMSIKLLVRALSGEDALEEIPQIMDFLGDYTRTHFGTEERFMVLHDYPVRAEHQAEHALFTQRIQDIQARCDEGENLATIADDVCSQLGEWLVSHIALQDRKLSMFLLPVLAAEAQATAGVAELSD